MWYRYSLLHYDAMEKWRDASADVVGIQLEAAMETSIVKISAFHINKMEDIKIENSKLKAEIEELKEKLENTDKKSIEDTLRKSLKTKIRKELLEELKVEKDNILGKDEDIDDDETEEKPKSSSKPKKSLFGLEKNQKI